MDIKEIYKQLTNIDIEEQKQLWDERGKGYYGEYLVFCELYKCIAGNCKILMNLEIPVKDGKNTEIDLIMIHETGLYVFEIKHYKGTIYGKDADSKWTQYFRTVNNNSFKNPIMQNQYHIENLKKLFPDMAIFSEIVFTSEDCDLKVMNEKTDVDVCSLSNLGFVLQRRFSNHDNVLDLEKIDEFFVMLSKYSQMQAPVEINEEIKPFLSWVQPSIEKLREKQKELEFEKEKVEKNNIGLKKAKTMSGVFCIVFAVVCVALTILFSLINKKTYDLKIQENTAELNKFKQNFLHIDEIDNEYIDSLSSYVEVSNANLSELTDDAVSFSADLTMLNEVYLVRLQENAKYVVMTTSGKIYEYNVFGDHLKYNLWSNILGKHYKMSSSLIPVQFYGIANTNDVTYIKLINIELSKSDTSRTVIKDELELELYSVQ